MPGCLLCAPIIPLTPIKHNLRGRGNSFCKNSGRQYFVFAKATNIGIFKYRFGRHCFDMQNVPAWGTLAIMIKTQLT